MIHIYNISNVQNPTYGALPMKDVKIIYNAKSIPTIITCFLLLYVFSCNNLLFILSISDIDNSSFPLILLYLSKIYKINPPKKTEATRTKLSSKACFFILGLN